MITSTQTFSTPLAASPAVSGRAAPGMPRMGSWTVSDEKGGNVVEFTSFIGLSISSGAEAPKQPVEQGGFYTFNKVASPVEATVTLAIQGDSAAFQQALDTLNAFTREAKLISVVTPEREFSSMTLVGFNYSRKTEEGVSLLTAELKLREVCLIPPRYSDTAIPQAQAKDPSDASTVNTGQKRPVNRPDLAAHAL